MLTSTKRCQREFFMIASEADCQIGLLGLQVDQKFNHAPTIGATVDIIAEENKLGGSFPSVSLTSFDEVLQLVQATVDVADGIGPEHLVPTG